MADIRLRDEKGNIKMTYHADQLDIDGIHGQLNDLSSPYFQRACQSMLFLKENTDSYPKTMNVLRQQDDFLISAGSYEGLSESEKAEALFLAVKSAMGF